MYREACEEDDEACKEAADACGRDTNETAVAPINGGEFACHPTTFNQARALLCHV